MDYMSLLTERMITGREKKPEDLPVIKRLFFLVRQETPRAIIPLSLILLIMLLGWLTPLGPVVTVISAVVSIVFLVWNNTDLIPARRLDPFGKRFKRLMKNLPFHIGFGLRFLVPVLNELLLSFAPVGATLYSLDHHPANHLPGALGRNKNAHSMSN